MSGLEGARKEGLDAFLEAVLENALKAVRTTQGSLMLLNSQDDSLEIVKRRGPIYDPKRKHRRFPVGQGIAGLAAKRCRPYVSGDVHKEKNFVEPVAKLNFRSLLAVPIVRNGRTLGIICADSPKPNAFRARDARQLAPLAKYVADSLDGLAADALIVNSKRFHQLEILHGVGQGLARRTFQSPEVLADFLKEVVRDVEIVLNADMVILYRYDQAEGKFETPPILSGDFRFPKLTSRRIARGDIPYWVVKEGLPLYVEHAKDEELLRPPRRRRSAKEARGMPFVDREKVSSVAGIPLKVADQTVGVMFVNFRARHSFTQDDKYIMRILATDAALAIHAARTASKTVPARKARAGKSARST